MDMIHKELDARGLLCPLPILKAKKALSDMHSGEILRVLATDPGSVRDFQAFARQNGQDLMNRDGNQTNYAHPDVIGALQYWRDLGAKHKVMPEGTVEWGTLRQAFTEGKTAMMWHTTGNLTAVKGSAKFPFGVAMLPASKQRGSPTGGGTDDGASAGIAPYWRSKARKASAKRPAAR